MEIRKVIDIQVNVSLINCSTVAKTAGISTTYALELIRGTRSNKESLQKVRNAIVFHYKNVITFVSPDPKGTDLEDSNQPILMAS